MYRKMLWTGAVISLGMMLAFNPATADAAAKYTIKLGHFSIDKDPGAPPVVNAYVFKNNVASLSNGEIEVKTYPNFQLEDVRAMMESTQMGAIQASFERRVSLDTLLLSITWRIRLLRFF